MVEIPDDLQNTLDRQDLLYTTLYSLARQSGNSQLTALTGIVSKYVSAAAEAAQKGVDCRENRLTLDDHDVEYLNEKLSRLFKDVMLIRPSVFMRSSQ